MRVHDKKVIFRHMMSDGSVVCIANRLLLQLRHVALLRACIPKF